jgi:hypothetical protein
MPTDETVPAAITDLDRATLLQNGLLSAATGGVFDGGDNAYKALRRKFLERADTRDKLPDFVERSRDLSQFWQWIKHERRTYEERRRLIWDAFRPLLDYLEGPDRTPAASAITETLQSFDPEHVRAAWQKALDRRTTDPEGAITAARTLLETVCKHILDDSGTKYAEEADLPKLWSHVAERLNLAPNQHEEESFRAILGSCQQIVNRLGTLRNKIGDAHGKGRRPVKPKPRHAELAVNLAGTMAAFLVSTWKEREAGEGKGG